jgi:hypothetical protein
LAKPTAPLASGRLDVLRIALITGVAWSCLAAWSSSADARGMGAPYGWYDGWYAPPAAMPARKVRVAPKTTNSTTKKDKAEPNKKDVGFGQMPKGPLQIVVSIGNQKVTLFSNGVRVAQGPVSTGVPGRPTPTGVFSIIEKDRYHHSNLYSNAPMPYMQRITWSGVALHEGVLPGYPASHGCIRMSHDFAQKLWPVTNLGVRVIVAHNELAPVDFAHPKQFVPKPKPPEPAIAAAGATDGRDLVGAIVMAQATLPQNDAIDAAPQAEPVKPAPTDDPAKPVAPPAKAADQPTKRTGQVAVFVSRKEQKIFVRQGFVPLFDMPIVIEQPDQPLGTHVFTAMEVTDNGSGMRWNLISIPSEPAASTEQRDTRKKSKEAPAVRVKPPASATQALNRIQIPQEAADRIGEILIPGSSLVISDEGLGRETGRYTEFIVLSR